jgi:hypothetical protein
LTLERPLSSEPTDLEPVPALPGAARDRALQANHDRANRFALDSAEAVIQDGRLEARLAVPAKAPWPRLLIRAYAATDRAEAMGTAPDALARSEAPQNP